MFVEFVNWCGAVLLLMLRQHYSTQLSTVNCDRSSIDFVMSEVVGTGHWAASGAPSLMLGCCNGSLTSPLSHFTLTEITPAFSPLVVLAWLTVPDIPVNVILASERIMSIDVDIDLWLGIRLKFHPNLSEYIIYNINIETLTVTVLRGKDTDTCWCNYATQEAYWGKTNSQHECMNACQDIRNHSEPWLEDVGFSSYFWHLSSNITMVR